MAQLDIFSLTGRVALVSGGGGAIGSALAEALAGAGARVGVTGRTLETCEATVERIQATGSEGLAVSGDAISYSAMINTKNAKSEKRPKRSTS